MSDLIDRQLVLDRINKQREHLRPYLYPQDKIGDSAYRICAEFVERIPSVEPDPEWRKKHYKMAHNQGYVDACKDYENFLERKKGKWIDYTDEGFVECPFCHSATNCDGNKDELHYCFSCGADMREGEESE